MLTVTSEVATTPAVFLNLWKHECNRVIADRFTNQQDKDWFEKTLKQVIEEDFDTDTANLMDPEPYFVDFLRDAPEPTGMTSVLTLIVLTLDKATQKLILGVEFSRVRNSQSRDFIVITRCSKCKVFVECIYKQSVT